MQPIHSPVQTTRSSRSSQVARAGEGQNKTYLHVRDSVDGFPRPVLRPLDSRRHRILVSNHASLVVVVLQPSLVFLLAPFSGFDLVRWYFGGFVRGRNENLRNAPGYREAKDPTSTKKVHEEQAHVLLAGPKPAGLEHQSQCDIQQPNPQPLRRTLRRNITFHRQFTGSHQTGRCRPDQACREGNYPINSLSSCTCIHIYRSTAVPRHARCGSLHSLELRWLRYGKVHLLAGNGVRERQPNRPACGEHTTQPSSVRKIAGREGRIQSVEQLMLEYQSTRVLEVCTLL